MGPGRLRGLCALLLAAGLGIELTLRLTRNWRWRAGVALALLGLVFLTWLHLAVDLFA